MGQIAEVDRVRIFVDTSETLGLDVRTGIQRVVRELTRSRFAGDGRYEIIPVAAVRGRYHRLSAAGCAQLTAPNPVTFGFAKVPRTSFLRDAARLVSTVAPRLIKKVRRTRSARRMDRLLADRVAGPPIDFAPGDRVVLADTYAVSTALAAGQRARVQGAALIALTYDLIPHTHPDLQDAETVEHFYASVPVAMAASDAVVTISDWCMAELRRFGVSKPVGRFHLGHDMVKQAPTDDGAAAHWPQQLWVDDAPVFLMVGTIDPRKGQAVAIAAFDRLWAEGAPFRLLIIGRPGWDASLMHRITVHAEMGRRLFLVHGATDEMLDEAFLRCEAVIQASVVEGFGLPLVEALARGRPVIASDIEVFREIAGEDAVTRFPVGEADALAAAVRAIAADPAPYAAKARAFSWIDWNGARDQFADAVDRVARACGK